MALLPILALLAAGALPRPTAALRVHAAEGRGSSSSLVEAVGWTVGVALNDNGTKVVADVGDATFNKLFSACPVVQYVRNAKVHSVYVRTSALPVDAYALFTSSWKRTHNELAQDFQIFDSLGDARSGVAPWQYCNYGEAGAGYPHECGKQARIADQWFALPTSRLKPRGLTQGAYLQIYTGQHCPSRAASWTVGVALSGDGSTVETDIGEAKFNELFMNCAVVRYVRNEKVHSVYVRLSNSTVNAYKIFTDTWNSTNNMMHTDFQIYSSLDDAREGQSPWRFCNYNDPGVGYPRDCGKQGASIYKWFTMPTGRFRPVGVTDGARFELYSGPDCPSNAYPKTTTTTPAPADVVNATPGATDFTSSGCWSTSGPRGEELVDDLGMSIGRCFSFCKLEMERGMRYFSLTAGKRCWCAPLLTGSKAGKNSCDTPCSGDKTEICGGAGGATNMYLMMDCTPPTKQELEQEAADGHAEIVASYASFAGQTCGQAAGSMLKVGGSKRLVASADKCKVACMTATGSMQCQGFTFEKDQQRCTFHMDVLDGEVKKDPKATCFFKKLGLP